MTRTLTGSIKAAFGLTYLGDLDFGNNKALLPFAAELAIGSGTGAGQCNLAFWDHRTIAGSGTDDIDLAGALTDPLGGTGVFTKVKGIYIKAKSTNGGNLVIGGDAAPFLGPFADATDKINLAAGDVFLVTKLGTGWTVTATTADILQIVNSDAGSAEYDIAIIGLS